MEGGQLSRVLRAAELPGCWSRPMLCPILFFLLSGLAAPLFVRIDDTQSIWRHIRKGDNWSTGPWQTHHSLLHLVTLYSGSGAFVLSVVPSDGHMAPAPPCP